MSSSTATRDWHERIRDILEAIQEINGFILGMDRNAYLSDRKTVRAVELNLIVIGEAVTGIPSEVQRNHPEIPWSLMRGMRNRIVHAYHSVDEQLMWETINDDLPPLSSRL